MKALIVTLRYHWFPKPLASQIHAVKHYANVGGRYHWVNDGDVPLLDSSDPHDIVTAKYRHIQDELFLKGDYDVFIAIEDDMLIPPDTFTRLIAMLDAGNDVAYGLYCWRRGRFAWSAYTSVGEEVGQSIIESDKDGAIAALESGAILPVAGVGMGCTAITRDALERVAFQRRGHACNDWYFAVDAQERGLKMVCDFGLVCGHATVDPTPFIVYPAANELMYRKEGM